MTRLRAQGRARKTVVAVAVVALLFGWGWGDTGPVADEFLTSHPNNLPHLNANGFSTTFSTEGFVDLTSEYSQAQGTNGRSCQTCHIPQQAWAINPGAIQLLFFLTGGTHPIFNPLDADNPDTADFTTVAGRHAAYTMLMTRGVFRRGGAPRAEREWDIVAVDDPHGFANSNRLVQWRRVMPTINFPLGSATVNWDGGNSIGTDQVAGLVNQARRNIDGAQEGDLPPVDSPIVADIVGFESALFTAQVFSFSAGLLNAAGARGGAQAMTTMTKIEGRFDLFDAWQNSSLAARAKIFRGQELFNNPNPGGRRCGACHSSANNGTSINNTLFDIQTASAEARTPDLPLYTLCRRVQPGVSCVGDPTAETRQLTDTGRGNVTGAWTDLGRFKTPTIRALSARAPYFHNGIAETLEDVVRHYEQFLGFVFTDQERADLVAFLKAL
jgi:hypothetical protein